MKLLSGLWEKVVDKGAGLISEFITDKDLAVELEHKYRMAMGAQKHEFDTLVLQVEKDMFAAQQKTIQAELHQSDLYTKRTRPKIARQSWYVTAIYALMSSFLPMLPASLELQAPVFEWQIFMVLASPALTYMGVRGFDKWNKSKTF